MKSLHFFFTQNYLLSQTSKRACIKRQSQLHFRTSEWNTGDVAHIRDLELSEWRRCSGCVVGIITPTWAATIWFHRPCAQKPIDFHLNAFLFGWNLMRFDLVRCCSYWFSVRFRKRCLLVRFNFNPMCTQFPDCGMFSAFFLSLFHLRFGRCSAFSSSPLPWRNASNASS